MSKATRKALGIFSGALLGASSLVGVPALAATPYNVEIAPSSGENWSLFNGEDFSIDITAPTLIASEIVEDNFAIQIVNADGVDFDISFGGTATTYDYVIVEADGTAVSATSAASTASETFDFTADGVVAIVYGFNGTVTDMLVQDLDVYGDDGKSITVTTWIDNNADVSDVDAATASASETITFVDPATVSVITKIERAVSDIGTYYNADGDSSLAGSIRFSKTLNLDQTDLDLWEFYEYVGTQKAATTYSPIRAYFDTDDTVLSADSVGRQLVEFTTGATLVGGSTYQIKSNYNGETRIFSSAGFSVVEASDASIDTLDITVTEDENVLDDTTGGISLREGTASLDLTAQVQIGSTDEAVANQPVVVTVTAVTGTASVRGVAGTAAEGESKLYSTLTNADGQVDIMVSSSAEAGDSFTVYAVLLDSTGSVVGSSTTITATYEAAVVTDWAPSATVLTGSTLTLSADLTDQFGEPISVNADGDEIYVGFIATDADNLDEYVAVVNGSASVTFATWLEDGESDVLTLTAHVGDEDDRTDASALLVAESVTLYADLDVAAVTTTSAEYDATVGYYELGDADGDFLVTGDAATITGTVIDDAGAGIPGAQVDVAADGLHFQDGSDPSANSMNTITVSADESGTFSVLAWTHVADDVDVTVSSGGQSETVVVAGALASGGSAISADNLVVAWNLPSALVYNTTYAVTGSVTDVWGNPIENAELTFTGEAAATFNSGVDAVKDTNSKGQATVYLRSLEDVSGLAAVSVVLSNGIDIDGDATEDVTDVGDPFTDDEDTSWDESEATDTISAEITFLTSAPAAVAGQKLNSGSFNGYVAVYAKGYKGATLSWKIAGKWFTTEVESDYVVFQRKTVAVGLDVNVELYINGVKPAAFTKTVATK